MFAINQSNPIRFFEGVEIEFIKLIVAKLNHRPLKYYLVNEKKKLK